MNTTLAILALLCVTLILVMLNLWLALDDGYPSPKAQQFSPKPPCTLDLGVSFSDRERIDEERGRETIQQTTEPQQRRTKDLYRSIDKWKRILLEGKNGKGF